MLSRKLFCVNDPGHADFGWAAESVFFHMRKFDACGNTTSQWTMPVAATAPGELTCAVCGGAVYVAKVPAATAEDVAACDILGRCRLGPADANLARLAVLAGRLAAVNYPAARAILVPSVAALLAATEDDPAAVAILERHRIRELFAPS
ncbi:hypothetical protein [Solidesulfovibrio sp.]|uniref:hypothetical protein n=1 Tax=Solidesulfovibrio sp. TaxID=2910990 RepID=UPI002613D0F4|nr:hypothetical protein [Solidesulfovibrio sp.]